MLTILDYGAGNQTSVLRALRHLGIDAAITDSPDRLSASEGIIFPGVGSAGQAMDVLTSKGLDSVLAKAVREKQPVLGICLGEQILGRRSEETGGVDLLGPTHGLPELLAGAAVVGLHLWKKNTLLSIAVGTALYMVLVQAVFV